MLETELAKKSARMRELSDRPSLDDIIGRVAAALPKDGALIEFVAYADRPVVPKLGTPLSKIPSDNQSGFLRSATAISLRSHSR